MQIKVTRKIFLNGSIIQPGTIINFAGNEIPVWGKAINKTAQAPQPQQKETSTKEGQAPVEGKKEIPEAQITANNNSKTETKDENEKKTSVAVNADLEGKTDAELAKILDTEITKAVEKNIMLDDLDKKSPLEQIIEIRTKLAEIEK